MNKQSKCIKKMYVTIPMQLVYTNEQLADIFNKALSLACFGQLQCKLKLVSTLLH